MKLIFLYPILLFLTACASLGPPFTELSTAPKSKALIYVYRPSVFTGSARSPDIFLSGTKVGTVPNGSYFLVEANSGSQNISMKNFAGEETGKFDFTLKPGQTYFLRVDLSSPTLLKHYTSAGVSTQTACPFMGVNIMLPPSKTELFNLIKSMDTRAQTETCWAGFMFVKADLAKSELPDTRLNGK